MPETDTTRMASHLVSRQPCVVLSTTEEEYALEVIREAAEAEQREVLVWTITTGLRDGMIQNAVAIADTAHPAGAMTWLLTAPPRQTVIVFLDLAGHLKDERTMRCLRELIATLPAHRSTAVLLDAAESLPPVVNAVATRLTLSLPDGEEVEAIVKTTLREVNQEKRVDVALTRSELETIVRNLQGLSRRQVRQAALETVCDDTRLDASDLPRVIAFKRRALAGVGLLEFVEAPTNLDSIGGLTKLKQWLDVRNLALTDEAVEFGITPPRGILMLGVQGGGKSLSAKAVATAWGRPLLRMDVGALFDRFIGESERRLRDALCQAEMMSPVILWIDEIEKAFASAAAQSVDGGLSKRMFGTLLTWMQEHRKPVFLIATANDVSALPPELLRKGRFDEIFFIDLPGREARRQIIEIHLRKRKRDPAQFELDALVAASSGFSGAEIEQAIVASLYEAFARGTMLSTRQVAAALENSPPLSVTMAEKMTQLRDWAKGRCVPAD